MNEKLNIFPNLKLGPGETPITRYIAIGVGGVALTATADGRPKITPQEFRPRWSGMLSQRPFVLRPEENDLTADERKSYGLRKIETHNEVRHVAYYLKEFSVEGVNIEQYVVQVRNGEETYVPLIATNEDMNPTPAEVAPDFDTPTLEDGDYILTRYVVTIPFTPKDVEEFVNAIRIIDGDEELAVISEFGLIGAVRRNLTVEGPGGAPIQFNETVNAVMYEHVATYENFAFTNNGTQFVVEAGIIEPMLTSSK